MAHKNRFTVFVSYSRHDEELVRPLAEILGVAAEEAVFLDVNSLKPGDDWQSRIESTIREASVFVLCWCCASKASEFVAHEISIALESSEKKLVPVLFCPMPLPKPLASRQWIDLRGRIVHACEAHEQFSDPLSDGIKNRHVWDLVLGDRSLGGEIGGAVVGGIRKVLTEGEDGGEAQASPEEVAHRAERYFLRISRTGPS